MGEKIAETIAIMTVEGREAVFPSHDIFLKWLWQKEDSNSLWGSPVAAETQLPESSPIAFQGVLFQGVKKGSRASSQTSYYLKGHGSSTQLH